MTTWATDNISDLVAQACPGGWVVRFASANAGLCHQLYLNGHLEDYSQRPEQRELFCRDAGGVMNLAVVAVEFGARAQDISGELGLSPPSWLFVRRVARSMTLRRGDVIELLWDAGTGTLLTWPILAQEAWPVWMSRTGMGEDAFGQGAFGGSGADGEPIVLEWPVSHSGTYRFVIRTRDSLGQTADGPVLIFTASVPAGAAKTLGAAAFDPATDTLTFSLS